MSGFVEFLGWFGAVTVLLGYLLFSTGKLPNGPVYQLFNLVGGLSVAVNVAAHHAVPSTIVNGIWALVAMVVLVRMARGRRVARRGVPAPGARLAQEPVAHVEPPTTTAVLPVIGPALRAHDEQHAPTTAGTTAATEPMTTTPTTGSIPLVESVPVITAALALALVHAAQDHTAAAPATGPGADERPEARDRTEHGTTATTTAAAGTEHRTSVDAEHHTPAT